MRPLPIPSLRGGGLPAGALRAAAVIFAAISLLAVGCGPKAEGARVRSPEGKGQAEAPRPTSPKEILALVKGVSDRVGQCFPSVFKVSVDKDMGPLDRSDPSRLKMALESLAKELTQCLDGSGYGGQTMTTPTEVRRWLGAKTCDDFAKEAFRSRECFALGLVLEEAGFPVPRPGEEPPMDKASRKGASSRGPAPIPHDGVYHASHILVIHAEAIRAPATASRSKAEAARLGAMIATMARLPRAGFAGLARKYSECASGPKGGDLGRFTLDKMVPEFSQALRKLHPGEVSGAVETRFGYHVILRH